MTAPLAGVRVLELAAIGPAPLGVMLLADLGAEVIRVDRAASVGGTGMDHDQRGVGRGRKSIAVDLKQTEGTELVLELAAGSDVLVEGFRPGVAERLGVGPDDCLTRNPGLVYARMTGWGQEGPLAARVGHDINYAGISGMLHGTGAPDRPPYPPLNYLADYGGGATFLAIGVLAALRHRDRTGEGQVVDVAMVDGAATLTTLFHYLLDRGEWTSGRGENLLDGSRPFYRCYRTADGEFVAVGAIEPQFYRTMLVTLGLDPAEWPQEDASRWPDLAAALESVFATRARDEWTKVFADVDACVTPVLSFAEAPEHEHNVAREGFVDHGWRQPAPAPRFSATPLALPRLAPEIGDDTRAVLAALGRSDTEIQDLHARGVVA